MSVQPLHQTVMPVFNSKEFDLLYRRSKQKAFNLAFRMLRNRTDAEDVTQEAFVKAWRHIEKFDRSRPFDSWLYRIVSNLALDLIRRKKTVCLIPLDLRPDLNEDSEWAPAAYLCSEGNPESILLSGEIDESLQRALDSLPPEHKKAVWMAFAEERPYEEISALTESPMGTVRSRIHRGRQKLLSQLVIRN